MQNLPVAQASAALLKVGRHRPSLAFVRRFGWLEWAILALVIVALVMRLWELAGRTMHYDEAIHLHTA